MFSKGARLLAKRRQVVPHTARGAWRTACACDHGCRSQDAPDPPEQSTSSCPRVMGPSPSGVSRSLVSVTAVTAISRIVTPPPPPTPSSGGEGLPRFVAMAKTWSQARPGHEGGHEGAACATRPAPAGASRHPSHAPPCALAPRAPSPAAPPPPRAPPLCEAESGRGRARRHAARAGAGLLGLPDRHETRTAGLARAGPAQAAGRTGQRKTVAQAPPSGLWRGAPGDGDGRDSLACTRGERGGRIDGAAGK